MHPRRRLPVALLFAGLAIGSLQLRAQIVWVGGSGPSPYDVTLTANWASPLAGDGSDSVEFGVVTAGLSLVSVPSGVALHDILLNNGAGPAYVFTGPGDLRFNGNLTAAANGNATFSNSLGTLGIFLSAVDHTIDLGTGATVTIDSGLHDYTTPGSITKTGLGTLTLTGANTYGGGTTVRGGLLGIVAGSISHGSADLEIGVFDGDDASLQLLSGGTLTADYGRIGINSGSTGLAQASGSGSTWTSNTYLYVGEAGTGTLTIDSGAHVTSANISIGNNAGGLGAVVVDGAGSSLAQTDTTPGENGLFVGSEGTGTLTVSNGATIASVTGSIGNNSGGAGTVAVSGPVSAWTNSGNLFVGAEGSGTLIISSGGAVDSDNVTVGNNTGGTGLLTATGSGSTLAVGDTLRIGWQGAGTLNVLGGAAVTSVDGIIGDDAGGTGTATVNGAGSTWTLTNELFVGDAGGTGQAILNITSGGVVSDLAGSISNGSVPTNYVTVNGVGSAWNNTTYLRVGHAGGNARLTVRNGGTVTSATADIGLNAYGAATIQDAGSAWTIGSTLHLGDGGTGSLTLKGNGRVNVGAGAGTITLGDNGGTGTLFMGESEYSVYAGIVNAAIVTTGSGTGLIKFDTGTTAAAPTYLTRDGTVGGTPVLITGPTAVTNQFGYNVLAGANTFSGGTTITNGTLESAAGSSPLGYGTVTVMNGGTLAVNGGYVNNTLVLQSGSRLVGSTGPGLIGNATIGSGVALSPGFDSDPLHGPLGSLSFADLTLAQGGMLEINVKEFSGALTYDSVSVSNPLTLTITADAGQPFTLKLISLNASYTPGALAGGVTLGNTYSLAFLTAQNISGDFTLGSNLILDATGFDHGLGVATDFSLTRSGNTFSLNFTPVPEPSTYALMALGLGCLGLTAWRKRRA